MCLPLEPSLSVRALLCGFTDMVGGWVLSAVVPTGDGATFSVGADAQLLEVPWIQKVEKGSPEWVVQNSLQGLM